MTGTALWALIPALIGLLPLTSTARCTFVDTKSQTAVREEVNRIYNVTLDQMQYTLPSGMRATTWLPPDDSVRGQIQCLGTAAVPQISEVLHDNDRPFGRLLAIEMLGWIGGAEIVPPLSWALARPGDFLITKSAALDALASAPPDKAIPVIEEALRAEKNPRVREKAASVLARLRGVAKD